eukprot:CAMPEP_0115566736 /NCGR_PEP_ID=MMETSP0271-20121206/103736_1 /TAXON_ID=71861 /ORGANISM="Scrippsiella trochoidea, Strain CCMP3099" /LENGTH=39 /DNA_ID= /DNA_START= /DNA_END= /DNA_ORIENTATION=
MRTASSESSSSGLHNMSATSSAVQTPNTCCNCSGLTSSR